MFQVKLQAAKELILTREYAAARAILETLPLNATATKWLAKLDDIAPATNAAQGWEYRIVALDPPGVTEMTVYDTGADTTEVIHPSPGIAATSDYLQFIAGYLNKLGEHGWELVALLKPLHSNEAALSNYRIGHVDGSPAFLMKRQRR